MIDELNGASLTPGYISYSLLLSRIPIQLLVYTEPFVGLGSCFERGSQGSLDLAVVASNLRIPMGVPLTSTLTSLAICLFYLLLILLHFKLECVEGAKISAFVIWTRRQCVSLV